MTDPVAIALITALCTLIPTLLTIVLTSRAQRKDIKEVKTVAVESAVVAVEAVKSAADVAGKAAVVTETIHGLVNSQLAVVTRERDDERKKNMQLMAILANAGIRVQGIKINGPETSGGAQGPKPKGGP